MQWLNNVDWALVAQGTTAVVAAIFGVGKAINMLINAFKGVKK